MNFTDLGVSGTLEEFVILTEKTVSEKALKVGRQNFGKAKRFRRWLLYIRKRRCRAAVGTYRTIKIVCKCAVFSIYDRSGKNQDFGVGGIDFHRREVLVVGIFLEG